MSRLFSNSSCTLAVPFALAVTSLSPLCVAAPPPTPSPAAATTSTATPTTPAPHSSSTGAAPRTTPSTPNDQFHQACADYQRAADLLAISPTQARPILNRAASTFDRLLTLPGLRPHSLKTLQYNLGNARLLAGDPAAAILAFRRAEQLSTGLEPIDRRLEDSLSEARRRITPAIAPTPAANSADPADSTNISDISDHAIMPSSAQPNDPTLSPAPPRATIERLAAAARLIPRSILLITLAASWALAWGMALVRLVTPRPLPPRTAIAVVGLFAVLSAAAALGPDLLNRSHRDAVVLSSTTPRTGPDDLTFDAAQSSPLAPGTEVRILELRAAPDNSPSSIAPQWAFITLDTHAATDTPLWVPASAIELINK